MTEKRFTWEYSHNDSTGEIIDWIRNECLMTDYLQKYELEEWCQELNKIVDENNQLRKENEQLKLKVNGLKSELSIWKEDANEHIKETNKLFEELQNLKNQIKIYELFLDQNDLNIEWDLFCTLNYCVNEEDTGCQTCKYMGLVDSDLDD